MCKTTKFHIEFYNNITSIAIITTPNTILACQELLFQHTLTFAAAADLWEYHTVLSHSSNANEASNVNII